MDEPEKSHSCDAPGCNLQFEDVTHLVVHKKKHEMVLNLGNGQKNIFVADQTPTPTHFIRNCEELGLFQDLQNVNPFEETFRKAVETGKTSFNTLQEVDHLHVAAGSDDTLHTPHVFPYITEDAPSSTSPVRSIIASLASSGAIRSRSGSSDDKVVSVLVKGNCSEEIIVPEMQSMDLSAKGVVRQEADTSQRSNHCSSVEIRGGDGSLKSDLVGNAGGVQLLLRMPDGRLVALSNVQATNNSVHPTVLTFAPSQTAAPQPEPNHDSDDSLRMNVIVKTEAPEPKSSSQPTKVSLAKLKLKEVLTKVSKTRTKTKDAAESQIISKVCIPRRMSAQELSQVNDLQPSSTSSTRDVEAGGPREEAAEKKRKFLERNRAAAMRCREKRRSWIVDLEKRSKELEATNQQLLAEVTGLRAEVAQLKTLLLAHKDCPVTHAMQQGTQVTIPCSRQESQVISMALPAAGNVVLTNAMASRILSPPSTVAASFPAETRGKRAVGALKRRHTVSSGVSAAPVQPRAVVVDSPASQGIVGPQIISVAGLQPATTYILSASPRVEPLQVIKVNPNATLCRSAPCKMDVDSDSDVEVVAEILPADQPKS